MAGCDFVEPPPPTVVPTVAPPSDMLSLTATQYTYTLIKDMEVPGTGIVYRSKDENDNVYIDLDGQPSVRRFGDNLIGSKILVPGVLGDYSLRLVNKSYSDPYIFGPVTLTIFNPSPVEMVGSTGEPAGAKIIYDGIPIDYRIPAGRGLPGSTVTYLNSKDGIANLGGSAQFRTLPEGNSFVWAGRLNAYTVIQYDLRAIRVTTAELQMIGTAKIYLYEQPLLAGG